MKPTRDLTDEGREAIRPTAERLAKGGVVKAEQRRGDKAKPWYAAENIISVYLADGVINMRQAKAGYQFHQVYFIAHGSDVKACAWGQHIEGSVNTTTDTQQAARNKLHNYRLAHGEEMYACLVGIAGLGQTHSAWATGMDWHPSAGKPFLKASLNKHASLLKLPDDEK